MTRNTWSAEQLALLQQLYPHAATAAVASAVGRSERSCYAKASELGLKKTAEFFASVTSGRIMRGQHDPRMTATRFQPGQTPWNKGTHFTAGGRSALTRFKPGHTSTNAQPIGSYRVVNHRSGWQSLEQKTNNVKGANNKRWTPVTRIVWVAAYGPVPPGCVVGFKPGMQTLDPALITADKLDCITRAQLAARNHPNARSPELARLVQLKGAITRQVNRLQKQADQAREQATV